MSPFSLCTQLSFYFIILCFCHVTAAAFWEKVNSVWDMNCTQAHPQLNRRPLWWFPLPLGVRQREEKSTSTYNLSKLKYRQECDAYSPKLSENSSLLHSNISLQNCWILLNITGPLPSKIRYYSLFLFCKYLRNQKVSMFSAHTLQEFFFYAKFDFHKNVFIFVCVICSKRLVFLE